MVMILKDVTETKTAPSHNNGKEPGAYGDGGPVFLPPRKLSPLAQTLLAEPVEGDRVTAYDDLWYQRRPQQA